MKKKSKKEDFVMVCPKCKSPDVVIDKSLPIQPVFGLPTMYLCNNCKHTGYHFPEVNMATFNKFEKEVDKEHARDTKKDKTPLVDTAFGNFEVHIMWKLTAPVVLFFGLFQIFKEPVSGVLLTVVGGFMMYITYFKKRRIDD